VALTEAVSLPTSVNHLTKVVFFSKATASINRIKKAKGRRAHHEPNSVPAAVPLTAAVPPAAAAP
jgi:hypothetical protein